MYAEDRKTEIKKTSQKLNRFLGQVVVRPFE